MGRDATRGDGRRHRYHCGMTVGARRWIAALLHGVEPEPATLVASPALLLMVAGVAASLAAPRVVRPDPAATLRSD